MKGGLHTGALYLEILDQGVDQQKDDCRQQYGLQYFSKGTLHFTS